MRFALLVLMLVTGGHPGWAQGPPDVKDFAYGVPLAAPGRAAFYELELPPFVYDALVAPDFSDIRVFNHLGDPVAHVLHRPEPPRRPASEEIAIPFFPISLADRRSNAIPPELSLHVTGDSTHLSVRPGHPRPRGGNIILDLSAWKHRPDRLSLHWKPAAERFLAPVALEGSDDLRQWQNIETTAVLADLDYNGHRLLRRHIPLTGPSYRYLRLSLDKAPETVIEVTQVTGSLRGSAAQKGDRQWARVTGRPADGHPAAWHFTLPGRRPVDRVAVRLPAANAVARGGLQSRGSPQDPWRFRGRGLFYRLELDRAGLENPPMETARTADRHWRLVLETADASFQTHPPQLAVGWRPHRLLFIAREPGPFVLAYGSARVSAVSAPLKELLNMVQGRTSGGLVKTATAGKPYMLGGRDRLKPGFWPRSPRKTLLWAVMVVGVGMLALLAWRLVREMRVEKR
jgi:hypothetical protein